MNTKATEVVTLKQVNIIHETASAILVEIDGDTRAWFPLSQVHEIHRHAGDYESSIVISKWIAQKKGLD